MMYFGEKLRGSEGIFILLLLLLLEVQIGLLIHPCQGEESFLVWFWIEQVQKTELSSHYKLFKL